MKVLFRADASLVLGTGHVYRTASLAQALKAKGAGVTFVCRSQAGDMIAWLRDGGFETKAIPGAGSDEAADARFTLEAGGDADWIVVDHYGLGAAWERAVRGAGRRVLSIDDLARAHDCDAILDQNLQPEDVSRYAASAGGGCELFLGPRWALLRPEFARLRRSRRERTGDVWRVLVFYGGVDATNETAKALHALSSMLPVWLEVDVVLGKNAPHAAEIESIAHINSGVRLHRQTASMAELMAAADLSLGAGGTTSWERCALGLPAVVTSVADNQNEIAKALHAKGAAKYIGPARAVKAADLKRALERLVADRAAVLEMSRRAAALCDGDGAKRLAEKMIASVGQKAVR